MTRQHEKIYELRIFRIKDQRDLTKSNTTLLNAKTEAFLSNFIHNT